MTSVTLVTILTADQVGLVAAIADYMFTQGVNLRDTTFAALGRGAEFTAICELPTDVDAAALEAGLKRIPALAGAEVRVSPYTYDPVHGPMGRITHEIDIYGGDQLGLIARLADIFTQYEANIVRMNAQKLPDSEGGDYVTRFAVSLPPANVDHCLSAVTNTAGSLGLFSHVTQIRR